MWHNLPRIQGQSQDTKRTCRVYKGYCAPAKIKGIEPNIMAHCDCCSSKLTRVSSSLVDNVQNVEDSDETAVRQELD